MTVLGGAEGNLETGCAVCLHSEDLGDKFEAPIRGEVRKGIDLSLMLLIEPDNGVALFMEGIELDNRSVLTWLPKVVAAGETLLTVLSSCAARGL